MSVEVLLIPAAMAAYGMWKAARIDDEDGRQVCVVQTRMRDDGLLAEALRDLAAQVEMRDDKVVARWTGVSARFERMVGGGLTAHFEGEVDAARAEEIVAAVDRTYARRVQVAVYEKIRARAAEMDLAVESEMVHEDHSITLVLQTGVET